MRRALLCILGCAAALGLSGCPKPSEETVTETAASAPADARDQPEISADLTTGSGFDPRAFAGTFTGTLPCADCPGMDVTVELAPDGTYRATHVYRERPAGTWSTEGSWSLEADNDVLRLAPDGDDGEDQRFAVESHDRIVMLDRDGRRAESGMDYSLSRKGAP